MTLAPDAAAAILRSSSDAIIVTNSAGEIVYVNGAAEELFAYTQAELLGSRVEMLMPEGLRDGHEKLRQQFLDAPRSRPLLSGLTLKGRRKNGDTFDAEIALTPVSSGDEMLVSSTIRDITSGNSSEAYFRTLLESAPDAMIIVDKDGRIAVFNDQAEKMFCYAREELVGKGVEMLLPEAMREQHLQHRREYIGNPHVRPMGSGMDLLGRQKDGSEFPVEISISPVHTATGTFVSSMIRDVTERRKMERDLIDARQAAERANKANTAFLAAASHDLRQPVQALNLLNGALRRTVKVPLALEMVESQQQSLDAMTNLLNSLLDISRLDAGAVHPEIENFPIQRLIDRLSAEFSRQASHKSLQFDAEHCDTLVQSDPNLLGEIIQNLVSNAIRYTDKGRVRLCCTEVDGKLCIHVHDTGVGISADQIDEIFQEFHQIKTPGADKEGFGLGLAIVRRLADLMDHEILVESDPGVGSCFSVCVPIEARGAATAAAGQLPDGAKTDAEASGLIILIEDDVKVANAWGLLLEAEGYRVATAASATEARAVVRHLDSAPQLVISDFHLLDGSTGVQAVVAIRKEFDAMIPAFIVSGDTSKVVQDARALENSIIMSKPVNPDHLLQVASAAITTGTVPIE